ncbi:MAG: serine hydrolase [Planctomycetes bacterium]|nr:serine hydrolase [Planctomycetota bacterium]MCB9871543.1 serine hydrolase [Planctomycetota bacterium]MCB9889442.1 serine hydrolase [Planctomycetota bacterium]
MQLHLLAATTLVAFSAASTAQVATYQGVTGAQHQNNSNGYSGAGYRMISLSVHGTSADPRYTAVWRKISGPAWTAFHGMPISGYQKYYSDRIAEGYRPYIVTATGTAANAVVAGVFTKDPVDAKGWHGLTAAEFTAKADWAQENGYMPTWLSAYGSAADKRYIAIFRKSTIDQHWSYSLDKTKAQHLARQDAHAMAWDRPALVTSSGMGTYSSIWRDDKLGPYVPFVDFTAAEFLGARDTLATYGYFPMILQGGGVGSATRYSGIFVITTTVQERTFEKRGVDNATMRAFDDFMETRMKSNGVRGGALAIAKDGRLVFARGYTWAESGYPITQPTDMFRIASCSKPLTSIAIHQAFQGSKLSPGNKLTQVLNIDPTAIKDVRLQDVTIDHLLRHAGGFDSPSDPMFSDSTIAAWGNFSFPISKGNILAYMTRTQSMKFNPGSSYSYSNYGFMLLGLLLEKRYTGNYENVVRNNLFGPLGVLRPRISSPLYSEKLANEVRHENYTLSIQPSVMSDARPEVPAQYGGFNVKNHDANGGWTMAAPDYVKVLASFDLGAANPILSQGWANYMFAQSSVHSLRSRGWTRTTVKDKDGKDVLLYSHGGAFAGTRAVIMRRADGLSFAAFFNGAAYSTWNGKSREAELNEIANTITTWPNIDLFPSVGIPAFKQHVAGKVASFGTGCSGSRGTVTHSVTGTPEIDQVAEYRLANARVFAQAVLHVGVSRTSWLGVPLPMSMAMFGAPGCYVRVAPAISVPVKASLLGLASVSVHVPNDPALIGAKFFTQYSVADPSANGLGLTFTNGVETTVGGFK